MIWAVCSWKLMSSSPGGQGAVTQNAHTDDSRSTQEKARSWACPLLPGLVLLMAFLAWRNQTSPSVLGMVITAS
jgi:hypothetical protein